MGALRILWARGRHSSDGCVEVVCGKGTRVCRVLVDGML